MFEFWFRSRWRLVLCGTAGCDMYPFNRHGVLPIAGFFVSHCVTFECDLSQRRNRVMSQRVASVFFGVRIAESQHGVVTYHWKELDKTYTYVIL